MPDGLALENNHWFGPEDIAGLTTAFEAALAKLGLECGLINAQPQAYSCQLDEGEIVSCELVVARCNPATVLDLIEEAIVPSSERGRDTG